MTDATDYYRILHVSEDAPQEIIRASYRALMQALRAHPDLGGDTDQASLINEAYATLGKPARRSAYDAQRQDQAAAREPGPTIPASGLYARPGARETLAQCPFCGWQPARDARDQTLDCGRCGSPMQRRDRQIFDEQDARALARLHRCGPVAIFTHWPAPAINGRMQNVSLNGMAIAVPASLHFGQRIKLVCEICESVARVVRVSGEEAVRSVGVEFETVRFTRARGGFVSTRA
jgi:hypothetical protein